MYKMPTYRIQRYSTDHFYIQNNTPEFTTLKVRDITNSNIYLQEIVTILTKTGEQRQALLQYDTAGGSKPILKQKTRV